MSYKKKLALVLGSYWGQSQGGAELQALLLAEAAIKQGWQPHYCFLSNGGPLDKSRKLILHAIEKNRYLTKLNNIKYPYAKSLYRELASIKPDIIYQRAGLSLTGVSAHFARQNRCRCVFHIANDNDVENVTYKWHKPWVLPEQILLHYGIRHTDTIIAQTLFQAELLKKNYGRNAVIIPNGHAVPEDIHKPSKPISVLWIANWKPVKQPEFFVQMVQALGSVKEVRFIMLGRTEGYERLVGRAREAGIDVRGEVPNEEVNRLLAESHILVNTSRQEGFSNTFIQAWMRRVPVVSLSVDPDNILRDKKLGLCAGEFQGLVHDLKALLENEGLRESMGIKAWEYAIANHSLANMDKILNLLESLI
ncbi:MAG: glycosyltransferase family 4 protein [Desulfobacula sp.]|nr:glycosyltransferase family 4 protein [Desulfobacula sp.]